MTATIDHDLHVHTFLSSCCKDASATPAAIIARAREQNILTLGFADHLWDASMPGASRWYEPQDVAHLLQIKAQIPEDTSGVRVRVGCESEYCGHGKIGISRAVAEQLDFVLIPVTHFHMKGFVVDASEIESPAAMARTAVKRFQEAVELDIATGFAHPFMICGFKEQTDAIFSHISNQAFADCFGRATEKGVSIEIHPGYFPGISGPEPDGFHDASFLRVLAIAKQCGCRFHFASDAHTLADIGKVHRLAPYVAQLGICDSDVVDG